MWEQWHPEFEYIYRIQCAYLSWQRFIETLKWTYNEEKWKGDHAFCKYKPEKSPWKIHILFYDYDSAGMRTLRYRRWST